MFIFWGTKAVVRKLGYVADFCPICRDIQTFQLSRVGLASHVYGASFGQGKLVGHQKKCGECGVELQTDASIYKDVQKKLTGNHSTDLTFTTFPNIREAYAERLSLEEQIAKSPATLEATTRVSLIKEPFYLLAPKVEKRFSSTHIDRHVGITLLLTIVGLILLANAFPLLPAFAKEYEGTVILIALGIGVAVLCVQGFKSTGRYLKREIYPLIARSLRPMRPSQAELATIFAELKRMDFKLAKKAKLEDLLQELAGVPE
ncbi:MAG TPA: hypothetical protein VFR01_00400 [Geobacterales bacterium]|nr:hypothetical protein [Geobacterales bacterium]